MICVPRKTRCILKLPVFVLFSFLCERNFHFHAAKILKPIIIKLVFLNCCYCLLAKLCPVFTTQWTVACQAPLSMGFPRQEYWIGLPFPSARNLPNPGIEPMSPALVGRFFIAKSIRHPLILEPLCPAHPRKEKIIYGH